MKWRILGLVLAALAPFRRGPERAALRDLGRELSELDRSG